MLRLTKTLTLAPRKRKSFFSPDFWKALAYAATFHAILLMGFRIATLPSFDHVHPLIPAQVEIDITLPDTMALLPAPETVFFPLENPTIIKANQYTLPEPPSSPFYTKKQTSIKADFSDIETLSYQPVEDL